VSAVPAILAVPRVLVALRARLMGDSALVALLSTAPEDEGGGPAIYTEGQVPEDARTDYLTVGPFVERSDSTMGDGRKWGSELTVTIKLVTMRSDVHRCLMTVDRVIALLHGTPLVVEDYAAGSIALSVMVEAYEELVGGVEVTHYPTLWTVRVHQPL
jgi:hypothetical protein